jgi:hypothetical protein
MLVWDIVCCLLSGCALLFFSYGNRVFDSDFEFLEAAVAPNSTVILVSSQLPNETRRLVADDFLTTSGCRRFTEYPDLVNTAEQVGTQELLLFMLSALALSLALIKKTQFTQMDSSTFFSFFSARDPLKTSTWFQQLEKAHAKLLKDQSKHHAAKLKDDVGSHVPDFLIWTCAEWSKFDKVVCSDALFMFALAVLSPLGHSISKPCVGFGSNIKVKFGFIGHGYDYGMNVDEYVDHIVKFSLHTIFVVGVFMGLESCYSSPYLRQSLRQAALIWVIGFSWFHALIHMEPVGERWAEVAAYFRLVCLAISVLRLVMASCSIWSLEAAKSSYSKTIVSAVSPPFGCAEPLFDLFQKFEEEVLSHVRLQEFTHAIKNTTDPGVKAELAKHFKEINQAAEDHVKAAYSGGKKTRVVSINHEVIYKKTGMTKEEWFCFAGRLVSMFYKVKVDKVEGTRLGIKLDFDRQVTKIEDRSLVGIWNQNHMRTPKAGAPAPPRDPTRREVEVGDRIVTVNDTAGTTETLTKKLEEATCKMVLHRSYDESVAPGINLSALVTNLSASPMAMIYDTKKKIFDFASAPTSADAKYTLSPLTPQTKPTVMDWAREHFSIEKKEHNEFKEKQTEKLAWLVPVRKFLPLMSSEAEFGNFVQTHANFYKAEIDVKVEGWRLASHHEAEAYVHKDTSKDLIQLAHEHVVDLAQDKHKVRKEEYFDKPLYVLLTKDSLSGKDTCLPVFLAVLLSSVMLLLVQGISSWKDLIFPVLWAILFFPCLELVLWLKHRCGC